MRPADAHVVVVGATGSIGRACVAALAGQGARQLLVGRAGGEVDALAVATAGATALQADVGTHAGRAAIVAAARTMGANALLYAAGVPAFGGFASLDDEALQTAVQVNLLAPLLLTRALYPVFSTQPEAHVVWVGSTLGRIGLPGFAAYSAAKFGLRGAAEALRREWGDGAVRIHHVAPRAVDSPFNSPAVAAYNRATGAASDPPERVARAVLGCFGRSSSECFLGYPERLAAPLNGLLGPAFDAVFGGHRRALQSQAAAPSDTPTDVTSTGAQT